MSCQKGPAGCRASAESDAVAGADPRHFGNKISSHFTQATFWRLPAGSYETPRISLRIHCIQIPLGASLSPGRARGIWMPPVFSAQAAGYKPHCVADHDHIANVRKMVGLTSSPIGASLLLASRPVRTRLHPMCQTFGLHRVGSYTGCSVLLACEGLNTLRCVRAYKFKHAEIIRQGFC